MSKPLDTAVREKLGTRHARNLRANGRIPAALQSTANAPHLDLSIDEVEFLTTRRAHQHLYELSIGGEIQTALVNQLTWDVFGERILHVEFRRVDRHQKVDVRVPIEYFGNPKSGVVVHLMSELVVRTTPDRIPNSVTIKIGDMEPGMVVLAGAVELPSGVELSPTVDPKSEVARVTVIKVEIPETPVAEAAPAVLVEGAEAAAAPAEKAEKAEKGEKGEKKPEKREKE
jgi:large subunit ribosomal protein L25